MLVWRDALVQQRPTQGMDVMRRYAFLYPVRISECATIQVRLLGIGPAGTIAFQVEKQKSIGS
jgi:hypothetical protein